VVNESNIQYKYTRDNAWDGMTQEEFPFYQQLKHEYRTLNTLGPSTCRRGCSLYIEVFQAQSAPCIVYFFLILDCEAIGTAASPGLLCQPRVIMKTIVEK
jgi:hypothetical protein